MQLSEYIHAIDTHTAGAPTRIVTSGLPFLKGRTVKEKMEYFKSNHDHYRKMLMLEPRGHSGMFGAVLTPPCRTEADLGVFFMTATGYLNMCVHSAMGVVAAGLFTGMVDNKNDTVILDTPSGLIEIKKRHDKSRQSLILTSDPAFVYAKDIEITIPQPGRIIVDIVFSGIYFVLFDIDQSEHSIRHDHLNELVQIGKELISEINHSFIITSPVTGENQKAALAVLYKNNLKNEGINAVISLTGSLDRSPCGAGTGARLALLHYKNQLNLEEIYTNISLINTRFSGFLSNMNTDFHVHILP